jgi:hypothetical protein
MYFGHAEFSSIYSAPGVIHRFFKGDRMLHTQSATFSRILSILSSFFSICANFSFIAASAAPAD